jgi:hypothetical protein
MSDDSASPMPCLLAACGETQNAKKMHFVKEEATPCMFFLPRVQDHLWKA